MRYHWLPLAALDVRVTLPPAQKVVGPPGVIVGVAGSGLTVTVVMAEGALEVEAIVGLEDAERRAQLVVGTLVHADKHTAALPLAACEVVDLVGDEPPATQVEEPDAEIGAVRRHKGVDQRRKELTVNVIKNASHATLTRGRCTA